MRLTILAAFLVGLVYSFYHWTIPNLWQVKPYSPLTLNELSPSFAVDEGFFYAPKITQPLADPGELVGSGLMALLVKISGGIDKAFMLADFIFPALTFLILASLLNLWLKNRLLALTATTLVMTFYHYLTYFPYLPSVIKLLEQYWKEGSYSTLIRSFHPQISLGLFLIFVALLWKRSSWQIMALFLTLLTYTHFFYWTVALAWLAWSGINRRLVKILAIWGLTTLPYWLFVFRLLPAADYWQRNYFYISPTLTQILLLIFGLYLARRKKFWLAFYAGIITLVVGTMLIKFGADDPIGHWFLRVVNPMTAILIVISLFNKLKLKPALLILICFLILGFQFRLHWQYFKNNAVAFRIEPERLEAFSWLDKNTSKNSVVVTPSLTDNLYLPAYTHNQPYLLQAQLSHVDNAELLQRFLQVYQISGISNEKLAAKFLNDQQLKINKRFDFDNCAGHFLYFRLFNATDYYSCSVPLEILTQILTQYQQTQPRLTYPADYWLGPDHVDFGELLWENSKYKVYKIND